MLVLCLSVVSVHRVQKDALWYLFAGASFFQRKGSTGQCVPVIVGPHFLWSQLFWQALKDLCQKCCMLAERVFDVADILLYGAEVSIQKVQASIEDV
jgi:hypothetical protein